MIPGSLLARHPVSKSIGFRVFGIWGLGLRAVKNAGKWQMAKLYTYRSLEAENQQLWLLLSKRLRSAEGVLAWRIMGLNKPGCQVPELGNEVFL